MSTPGYILGSIATAAVISAEVAGAFDGAASYRTREYFRRGQNGSAGQPSAVVHSAAATAHTLTLSPDTHAGHGVSTAINPGLWIWLGESRHIKPTIAAGVIAADRHYALHIWNNGAPVIVTDITFTGVDGVSVSGATFPARLPARGELILDVLVAVAGDSSIDGSIDIEIAGGGGTFSIPVTADRTSGWMFPPDWKQPVSLDVSVLTDIRPSRAGGEQRLARRQEATRTLRYSILTMGPSELRTLRQRAGKAAGAPLVTALWPDGLTLTADVEAGDTVLPTTPTAFYRFQEDEDCILWHDFENHATVQVQTINADGLVVDPIDRAFAKGDRIFPRFLAEPLGKVGSTLTTDRFGRVAMELVEDLAAPSFPVAAVDWDTYAGFPLFPFRANWATSPADAIETDLVVNALGYGRREIVRRDVQERVSLRMEVTSFDREEEARLTAFFCERLGRCKPFWVADVVPVSTVAAEPSGSNLVLTAVGFNAWYGNAVGNCRKHLAIVDRDGVVHPRSVTVVWEPGDGTEIFNLGEPVGLTAAEIAGVYLLLLMRFDQDTLQLDYHSDTMSRAAVSLLEVPLEVPA